MCRREVEKSRKLVMRGVLFACQAGFQGWKGVGWMCRLQTLATELTRWRPRPRLDETEFDDDTFTKHIYTLGSFHGRPNTLLSFRTVGRFVLIINMNPTEWSFSRTISVSNAFVPRFTDLSVFNKRW